jgi:hypothetical protein
MEETRMTDHTKRSAERARRAVIAGSVLPAMVWVAGVLCSSTPAPQGAAPAAVEIFEPPDSVVQAVLDNDRYEWSVERTTHFEIYYEEGTYPAHHLQYLKDAAEESRARALDILGENEFPRGIRLFMLDERDKMTPLMGSRPKGYTLVGSDAVLLVYNENIRPYMRHEVFHAVSIGLWGWPDDAWLREGSAVYADGMCFYEDPFRTIAAYLLREDMHLSLADLTGNFISTARQNDMLAYMEAGAFVQYLFETFDAAKIKQLWQADPGNIEDIFGKTIEALEADWFKTLEDVDSRIVDWDMLMDKGCG